MNVRQIIYEEVKRLLEATTKYGALANPKDFDPNDPEIIIKGFGTYTRSTLRDSIANRLSQLAKLAKDINTTQDPVTANRLMRNLASSIDESNVLYHMIKADIELAEQLEVMRTKGGRRSVPIPKQ
jgi:hypothetical protein